jgi:hypothetical protein
VRGGRRGRRRLATRTARTEQHKGPITLVVGPFVRSVSTMTSYTSGTRAPQPRAAAEGAALAPGSGVGRDETLMAPDPPIAGVARA